MLNAIKHMAGGVMHDPCALFRRFFLELDAEAPFVSGGRQVTDREGDETCHWLPAILPFDPVSIGPAGHVGNPALVLQIPGYRLADAGFKSFLRLPTQFALELSTVHRVAAVMTWAIGNVSD